MGEHTPGPWTTAYEKIAPDAYAQIVRGADGEMVAQMAWAQRPVPEKGRIATWRGENARLTAAAPDMLAALELFSREYDGFQNGDGEPCEVLAAARAAIARASQAPGETEW